MAAATRAAAAGRAAAGGCGLHRRAAHALATPCGVERRGRCGAGAGGRRGRHRRAEGAPRRGREGATHRTAALGRSGPAPRSAAHPAHHRWLRRRAVRCRRRTRRCARRKRYPCGTGRAGNRGRCSGMLSRLKPAAWLVLRAGCQPATPEGGVRRLPERAAGSAANGNDLDGRVGAERGAQCSDAPDVGAAGAHYDRSDQDIGPARAPRRRLARDIGWRGRRGTRHGTVAVAGDARRDHARRTGRAAGG